MKLLVLSVAVVFAASCRTPPAEGPGGPRREPIAVSVATAGMRQLPRSIEAGGVIRSATSTTLSSRTLANVTAVHVHAGDRVAASDLLIQLDDRDLVAQQRRAEQATTAVQRAHAAAVADREAAAAALGLARAANDRISGLFTRDAATSQERDEAVASLRAAESHVAAAEARVAQLAAEISAAQQGAAAADVSTSFASIRAPFAGVIVERRVEPGDLVTPGTPLLRLDGTDAFRLEASMDEARVGAIAPGSSASVWIDDAGSPIEGRVTEIARASDAGAHAFVVKVALPAAPGQLRGTGPASLRSGLFGRARFPVTARSGLAVPRAAVVQQGQLAVAWVVADGRAHMRVVALGEPTEADAVEVVAGLAAGDQVIVSPPAQLRDGDAVTVAAGGR